MSKASISQYRGTQISSASPEKTVLMLYDGAIGFLNSAINELEVNNNIPEKALLIEKTVKIIEYLDSCLDKEKGGEISTNLKNLYQYMNITLTRANLKNNTAQMKEVLELIQTIRSGWKDIVDKSTADNKNQQTTAYKGTPVASGNTHDAASMPSISVGIKA